MPTGLRASDAHEIRRLVQGDMRLLLRVGALLESKLSFTALALERLCGDEAGRRLIADRRLGTVTIDGFAAVAAPIDDCVLLADDAGWRVVTLADEVGNPLALAAGATTGEPSGGLPALVATLAPTLRAPVEGLMQARDQDQRAAALERLRYAAPPLSVVGELMPLLMADGAETVRERAIGLVAAAGGSALAVDLVRALQRRDDIALRRLAPAAAQLPADQHDLLLAAALAQAARRETSPGLVELCTALAPALAGWRDCERLIDLLLPTGLPLIDLVRALQGHDAPRIATALRAGLGYAPAQDAQIVVLLAAPGATGDDALLERGLDLLLEPGEEPRARMALAAALRRLDGGGTLAARLARRGMRIALAHDTSVYWLLAELCRDGAVGAAADELTEVLRRLLHEAPGPHLVSALEQQLPTLLPIADAQRRQLVEPLIEIVARYRAERTHDLVTAALTGLGAAAVDGVWEALEEHPLPHVRMLAGSLLPSLLPEDARRAAIARLVARLGRVVQGDERGCLLTAAAQIATAPPLDAEPNLASAVDAATGGLGRWAWPALGFLAAGPGCAPERRRAIVDQLLAEACAEIPDAPTPASTDPATGETTFELDDRLGAHTEDVPLVLAALARIGASGRLPEPDQRRLVTRLIAQWRAVSSWRTVWGPGNIQELARTLAGLAEAPSFPGPLRVQIVEALLPQLGQLVVARSLARVLTLGDGGSYLARLAARAADDLVRLATGTNYAEDEREELCETLVDFLAVPQLGPDADAVRRRLVGVIASLRDHASSRARSRLRYLAAELGPDLATRLDWA